MTRGVFGVDLRSAMRLVKARFAQGLDSAVFWRELNFRAAMNPSELVLVVV